MMNASRTGTTDASREVVESLARAYQRVGRADQTSPTVGTQHLLLALLDGTPSAAGLLNRDSGALKAVISFKDETVWLSEDAGGNHPPVASAVTALLREAEWVAHQKTKPRDKSAQPDDQYQPLLPSEALIAALGRMLVFAHELGVSWAHETHLLMGLLQDPGNRASEALLERRVDRDALVSALGGHPSARQDGKPNMLSVDGLRNLGMLDHPGGRGWGGRLGRWLTSGGYGSPVVPLVRAEAERQAVRLGHSRVATVHLLLAMLVLDDQLTTTGRRFRDTVAQVNTGAELLRTRGATSSAMFNAVADLIVTGDRPQVGSPAPTMEVNAEKALTRARLLANERKCPSTGTTHLLTALLADPDDPCHSLLSAIGVDVEELRRALG
jgi:hypothetical protein